MINFASYYCHLRSLVEFKFKMGWTFGSGPGCSPAKIGQFVNTSFIGDKTWKCVEGCTTLKNPVGTAYYYCAAANTIGTSDEKWEQGENSFQYTFKNDGPFVVSYSGAMWMKLDYGSPNGWNVQTRIDLRFRDDINSTNSSPITASKPLYTLQFACYHELRLPMYDSDGDQVKCRWARGNECDSVCHAVPTADLDEDTCTLKFNATKSSSYKENGWYAVALTFEDFPKKTIHIGNETYNETTPMSDVPLQFLIHLVGKKTPCDWKPEFISPTPKEGSKIAIPAGKTFTQKVYAANFANKNERVTQLSLTRPASMIMNGPINDPLRIGVVYWELSWTPTAKDHGSHVVCGMAEDSSGHTSNTRCITLIAWDLPTDPCIPNPCNGNKICLRIGSTQKIECICPVGSNLIGQSCIIETTTTTISSTATQTTRSPTTTSTSTTTKPTRSSRTTTASSSTTSTQTTKSPTTTSTSTTTKPTHGSTTSTTSTSYVRLNTFKTKSALTYGRQSNLVIPKTISIGRLNTAVSNTTIIYKFLSTTKHQHTVSLKSGSNFPLGSTKQSPQSSLAEGNCFKSKSVVLATTFLVILMIALSTATGILAYSLFKAKNELKALERTKDNFDLQYTD